MSTNKPPTSSGSSLEKAGRKQNNLPLLVAVFLLFHAVVLGGILWVGCKPHKPEPVNNEAPPPVVPLAPLGTGSNNAEFFAPGPTGGTPAEPPPIPTPGAVTQTPIEPPTAPPPSVPPVITTPTTPVTGPSTPTPGPGPVMPTPLAPPTPPAAGPSITPPTTSTPPPGMVAPPAPTGAMRKHTVSRGDTFYSIKAEYGISLQALKDANRGVDPTKLQLGQRLNIPAAKATSGGSAAAAPTGSIYVVKSGDYLGKIATKHKTTVAKLRALNGLTTDRIVVGQKLKLPTN